MEHQKIVLKNNKKERMNKMNLTEYEKNVLWEELYRIDGTGLTDFLNGWIVNNKDNGFSVRIKTAFYGEKLLLELCYDERKHMPESIDLNIDWQKWRDWMSYYFDPFLEINSISNEDLSCEEFKGQISYKILKSMGIIHEIRKHCSMKAPSFKDTLITPI